MKATTVLICAIMVCLLGADLASAADQTTTVCDSIETLKERQIPPEITRHLHDWWTISNVDRALQISLGVVGIVFSLVVSTFTEGLDKNKLKIFSFAAALAFGLVGAFDIGGKADAARSGWRHLTTAILRFQTDSCFTISKLIDAYSEGEDMVGNVPLRTSAVSSPEGPKSKTEGKN